MGAYFEENEEDGFKLEADDKSERLLSLTLTLLSSKQGFTKEELFRSLRGYRMSSDSGKTKDALDKMFERDKESLRGMGIQVEAFIRPSDIEDNTETRYFIPADTFVWPKGTSLSANQLRLLELAAKVWARASFSVEASRAVMRLKALGMPSDGLDLEGFAPRILTNEPGILQLEEAARDGIEVSFKYRAPDKKIETRTVQPWQVRHISGQWLLVCWDVEKNDIRNFMLKRIVSRIESTGNKFSPATHEQVAQASQSLEDFISKNVAVIKVAPRTEAWVHFELGETGANAGDGVVTMNFMDLHLLAETLRSYGRTVDVLQPTELKEAISKGLERVVNAHA
jgi:proteasome accessory factor B